MILPFLKGVLSPRRAPITWLLFLLNVIVFCLTSYLYGKSRWDLDQSLRDEKYLLIQGQVYSQFIRSRPERYSRILKKISDRAEAGEAVQIKTLAVLSLRDSLFFDEASNFSYHGDQVAYLNWKIHYEDVKKLQMDQPGSLFGVNVSNNDLFRWTSYQFIHGDLMHLLVNMWFLLIFGSLLEKRVGGIPLLLLYLGSGIIAAIAFVAVSGLSLAPLVGASGSVSGLMGLFSILYWKRRVSFLYYLLPLKGYHGFVYLPSWVVLAYFLLSDLRGLLGTIPEQGGVAHMAHIGGTLTGFAAALLFLMFYRILGSLHVHKV